MDLFVVILRFLLGMPARFEPIMVLADGRTSRASQRLAMHSNILNKTDGLALRQRSLQEWLVLSSCSERWSFRLCNEPPLRFSCQIGDRSSRV